MMGAGASSDGDATVAVQKCWAVFEDRHLVLPDPDPSQQVTARISTLRVSSCQHSRYVVSHS
jgi:hypothetical protein